MRTDELAPWTGRMVGLDDLDSGATVVVACSGGADSLALLALTCARGFDALAVYVDHGLRPTSAHDANVVRDAAARFGARFDTVTVELGGTANLEARARDARYAALEAVRASAGAPVVFVGHTADDQAETVLLNFLRGSGTDGLAGMRSAHGTRRRPLLALRRADTQEVCARLALAPVDDVMNHDTRHRRVWLRREVLPRLEAGAARDLVPVLARQAEHLRDDAMVLDDLLGDVGRPGTRLATEALTSLPRALARRVVRRWLGSPPPSSRDVDAVVAVGCRERVAAELAGGARVERVANELVVIGPSPESPREPIEIILPGHADAPPDVAIDAWVELAPPIAWPSGRNTCVLDADAAGASAVLRAARPGERFTPLGGRGTKTVFDALAESGVAASQRASSLVLAAGPHGTLAEGTPLWVLGYRIDHRVRVTSRTRRFLWIAASGPRDE